MRLILLIAAAVELAFAGFLYLQPGPPSPSAPLFPTQGEAVAARIAVYEGRFPCDVSDCDKVKVANAL